MKIGLFPQRSFHPFYQFMKKQRLWFRMKSSKSQIVEEIWNGNKINETTNNERDDFSQSAISKANKLELKDWASW